MCGRFAIDGSPQEVAEFLNVIDPETFPPRYNIAPTQPVLLAIAADGTQPGSNTPDRKLLLVRWGLLPSWLKDPKGFPLLINARSETAAEKASFRAAMRHRRALIPANGFYEWHRPADKKQKSQAWWVRPRHGGLVAFGALMETWHGPDGSEIDTGAILTTAATASFAPIHDRMPVTIRPDDFARWLDCKTQEPKDVADLMKPPPEDFYEAIPVSDLVNKVANTGPELQTPVTLEHKTERATKDDTPEKSLPGQLDLL
jgi:putative SOS response-associated peptidase YedK